MKLRCIVLAALAGAALGADTPDPNRLWALVIGVSKYTRAEPLQFAASDAASFAEFLASPRGGAVPREHVFVLLEEEATKYGIENALGTLTEKAGKGDTVYVYIAGHGYTKNRIGYFIPSDGDLTNPSPTSVRFTSIKETVEQGLAPARCRILVTDMCNAGRLVPAQSELGRAMQELIFQDLVNLHGEKGTFLNLLASRPNQNSYELEDIGRGVFTHAVLEALDGKAARPGQAFVSAEDLVAYVRSEVPKYTKDQQHPVANEDFDPKLPLSFLDRPGPAPAASPLEAVLVIAGAERSRYSRVEWIDPKTQARVVRDLARQQRVRIGRLQPGELELEFHGADAPTRKVRVKLRPGENAVDAPGSAALRGPASEARSQVASAAAALPAALLQRAAPALAAGEAELVLRPGAGTTVFVDGVSYGSGEENRFHELRGLTAGPHLLTLSGSDREQRHRVRLFAGRHIFDVRTGEVRYVREAPAPPSVSAQVAALPAADRDLYGRFLQALWEERYLAPAGDCAWDFYVQLRDRLPAPLADTARTRLAVAFGDRAQRTVLKYLRGEEIRWSAAVFDEGNALLDRMRQVTRTTSRGVESLQRFFAGRALLEQGQHDAGIAELRRAIDLDSEASHAYNAIGLSLWKQSRLDEAIAPLQAALALTPDWNYPRNTLALVYLEQRRYEDAARELETSVRSHPEDSTAHRALAQLHFLAGRLQDAERAIERALEFSPGNAYAYETLGTLHEARQRWDQAEAAYRLAMRLEPDEASFRLRLAELLRRRSRRAEAQPILERLAAERPADAEIVKSYAAALREGGDARAADAVFRRALQASPRDGNLRVVYASFLRESGRRRDARRQLEDALRASPSNAFAHHELALVHLDEKNLAGAEKELELAAAADPRLAAPVKLLGEIRAAQKRFPEALAQLRKALDVAIDPGQRQQLREAIAQTEASLLRATVDELRRKAEKGDVREAWSSYAAALRKAPEDRALRDAVLDFAAEHPREADPSLLAPSAVRQALETRLWQAGVESERQWRDGKRAEAARAAARALEEMDAAERRLLAGAAFSARNERHGVHALASRWGARLLELGDPAAARSLMDAMLRQKVFAAVPEYSPLTIDSLLIPADKPDPVRFSDFDDEQHPDRRAHEILARAAAALDGWDAAARYLPALEGDRPDLPLRLELARVLERQTRWDGVAAALLPAAGDPRSAARGETFADAVLLLARAQCEAGDCAASRATLQAARKALPSNRRIEEALRKP